MNNVQQKPEEMLPSNLEVEQAVLGSLLSDNALMYWPQVSGLLAPDHFAEPVHSRIFNALSTLCSAGKPATPLTLKSAFEKDETLQEIGGFVYLARLMSSAVPLLSLRPHAELLRDLSARRVVIEAATKLIEDAGTVTIDETFRPTLASHVEAMQALFDDGSTRKTTYTLAEASAAMVDRVTRIRSGEIDRNAIKTGIAALDRLTGGLHRGEYVILGGRPSMGKTALAVQLAYNIAEGGGGVFYASLEMPVPLLTPRLTSCRLWTPGAAVVSYQNLIRGLVNDMEMRWVESAAKEMKSWPLVIDDAPGLSAPELEARIQVAKSKMERNGKTLDLVIVDHLHKMRQPGQTSKVNEFTEISSRLAEMAKRLDCPVLALAQLNRSVESRDDKRPQLSDLRESGSIEQDADTVLFTYRPAYYLERQRLAGAAAESDRMAELADVKNKMEVLIEKQRSGPIGALDLWCDMAANVVRDPNQFSDVMEIAA
ncbi:MAG TPA: DnaB-like helicase C-terminal domain-containing protein [Aestuariivirga sp.]|nr:DnaB-like helicase C-terminal domain-containing protein [Aestuariivirga sp.]